MFASVITLLLATASYALPASTGPSGTYVGSYTVNVLFQKITETVSITADPVKKTATINIGGPLTASCPNEPYTVGPVNSLQVSLLSLNGLTEPGDCLKSQLDSHGGQINYVAYAVNANYIALNIKVQGITATINLYPFKAPQVASTALLKATAPGRALLKVPAPVQSKPFEEQAHDLFVDFEQRFSKVYATEAERTHREKVFTLNLVKINSLNQAAQGTDHLITEHTDRTPEEFSDLMQFRALL